MHSTPIQLPRREYILWENLLLPIKSGTTRKDKAEIDYLNSLENFDRLL